MKKANAIWSNAGGLYAVQLSQYIIPLAVLPYLSRVLEPHIFGLVLFSQAYAYFLSVFIEYGFNLSGTRTISHHKEESGMRSYSALGITGAQVMLAILVFPLALMVGFLIPIFEQNILYLWLSSILAVTLGLRNYWYFWGTERLLMPSVVVLLSGVVYIAGIVTTVSSPSDGWKVLAWQAVASILAYTVLYNVMFRETGTRNFSFSEIKRAFQQGWHLFVSGFAVSIYSRANVFVLGFLLGPVAIGYFAATDKITRAVNRLVYPVGQVFFPKITRLVHQKPDDARQLFRQLFWSLTGTSVILTLILFFLAPWLIPFVFGSGYAEAIILFQILVWALPLLTIGYLFGDQWAIPKGHDRLFRRITLTVGALSMLILVSLTMLYGVYGAAWSVVVTEVLAVSGFWFFLKKDRPPIWGNVFTKKV